MSSTLMLTQNNTVMQQAMASSQTSKVMSQPRYTTTQNVSFIGGVGTVRSCRPDSKTWTYIIEMAIDPETEASKLGGETTILLEEDDIQGTVFEREFF